jgi:uncharacterized protein YndB with AHSA1/START domain
MRDAAAWIERYRGFWEGQFDDIGRLPGETTNERQTMSETEEKPVLRMNRVIAASRERVFAAWTTPEAIKVWFGPASCRVLDVQVDLRVGGEYCFQLSTKQLGEIKVSGRYQEVTPPANWFIPGSGRATRNSLEDQVW